MLTSQFISYRDAIAGTIRHWLCVYRGMQTAAARRYLVILLNAIKFMSSLSLSAGSPVFIRYGLRRRRRIVITNPILNSSWTIGRLLSFVAIDVRQYLQALSVLENDAEFMFCEGVSGTLNATSFIYLYLHNTVIYFQVTN